MRYDLHTHTYYSPCSSIGPEVMLKRAKKAGLDGIAVTDHQCLKGALKVKKLNKDKNFEVILGEEVKTEFGDVVVMYLKEQLKRWKLFELIDEAKKQDAIMIIAHPFRIVPWLRFRFPLQKIKGKVEAIETFNSRNIGQGNIMAKNAARRYGFAETGGSDAHIPLDIGKGYTTFEGSLRGAIKKRQTRSDGNSGLAIISASMAAINKRILTPLKVKKRWI